MKVLAGRKALMVASMALAACSGGTGILPVVGGPLTGGGAGETSNVTSISIGLPDRAPLKAKVADIETKMNAFHLVVAPVDANCANATKSDQLQAYATNAVLNASLQQGCDYNITLELGNLGTANTPAAPAPAASTTVSYNSAAKAVLDNNCVSCHGSSSPRAGVDLSTYAGAQANGAAIISTSVTGSSMPRGGSLSQTDRATLSAWATAGYPQDSAAPAPQATAQPAPQAATKLSAIYYKNNSPLLVRKEDIAGKATFQVNLALQLQLDGQAIGLGTATPAAPVPNGNQVLTPQATPTPTPQSAANIPAAKDFSVVDGSGNSVKFSQAFKGKFMVLDFSQSTCGPCIETAREDNSDQMTQKMFDGTKCGFMTILRRDDVSDWQRVIGGASTFVGQRSYGGSQDDIATSFGYNFSATPTFLLIDAQGNLVDSGEGGMPDKVHASCM